MRKILSFFTAMLCAVAVSADPVVLPATLDVTNVSFRSEGMPDFVIEEGQDYAGTYFDMGAHDSSNDTLLYAEWDVTIEPIKYNLAVDVYNTNSWRVQLYLLNQAGDTLKSLRYKGSSSQKGQFAIGSLDLSDLEAGDYKVRARAATAWSQMKLKDVIFAADYQGVNVDLPGTLLPDYALLSEGASVANGAISFAPSTANNEYAQWNVSFAEAGNYNVTIDMTASNGHTYGVALLSADGATEIGAVAEEQAWDTGVKALGSIAVPAAGSYKVKLTNATQWSEAVLNSITFAAPAPVLENGFYLAGSMNGWGAAEGYHFVGNPANPAEFMLETTLAVADEFKVINYLNGEITAWYPNESGNYVVDAAHAGDVTIYFQPDYKADWAEFGGYFYVAVPEVPQPEMTAIYDWAGEIGVTIPGASGVEISTVKIHNNADQIPAIKFGSSYVYADGKWLAIKPAEGGFKAGDVVSVAAVFSNDATDGSKYAQVDIYAADGATRLMRGEPVVNGKKTADDPVIETLVLEADQDSLLLGRYGNTGMFITLLKVERAGGETPVVLEAPDAAPAAPTYAAYQVHAVYSATYNADCNFGEWSSGTQYTQEEFGKKYVTTGLGYFGLEFTGMDCSEMEALHLDVWAANDITFRVVPIHGGTEVGVTVNVQGQQWNAINIALSEFAGVENWSNVYQIKIDNASNLTFWLNNIYFYTTQEKTVDLVDGYYLIGNINGWDIHNLTADHLFAVNPANEAEYMLHYTLAEGNEFKVVSVANNALVAWYPEGENNNYVVDFAHAGEKDIYFRPDYQGGECWHAGCIYVVPTGHVAIDNVEANVPATKTIQNGMLLIIKGDKTYNVMGQIVK